MGVYHCRTNPRVCQHTSCYTKLMRFLEAWMLVLRMNDQRCHGKLLFLTYILTHIQYATTLFHIQSKVVQHNACFVHFKWCNINTSVLSNR